MNTLMHRFTHIGIARLGKYEDPRITIERMANSIKQPAFWFILLGLWISIFLVELLVDWIRPK